VWVCSFLIGVLRPESHLAGTLWLTVKCYLYVRMAAIIASQVAADLLLLTQVVLPSTAGCSCSSVCGMRYEGCAK
jgi:hypothetical protein